MRVNKNRYARTMRVLCAYYARASPNPRKHELVQTDKQNFYNTIVFTMQMQEMQHRTYFFCGFIPIWYISYYISMGVY